jgi:hypothetical protein
VVGEGARVVASTSVVACELLGCSQVALHQALTHREIKVSTRETISVPHDTEAAARTRDTVAQTLYLRLFAHIVDTGTCPVLFVCSITQRSPRFNTLFLSVNATLSPEQSLPSPRVCAVLDMFGLAHNVCCFALAECSTTYIYTYPYMGIYSMYGYIHACMNLYGCLYMWVYFGECMYSYVCICGYILVNVCILKGFGHTYI